MRVLVLRSRRIVRGLHRRFRKRGNAARGSCERGRSVVKQHIDVAQSRGELRANWRRLRDHGEVFGGWENKCLQKSLCSLARKASACSLLRGALRKTCCNREGVGLIGTSAAAENFSKVWNALDAEGCSVIVAGCHSVEVVQQGRVDGCWEGPCCDVL